MEMYPSWTPLPRASIDESDDRITAAKRKISSRGARHRMFDYYNSDPDEVGEASKLTDDNLKKTIERQATALFNDETALSKMIQQMEAYYLTYGRPSSMLKFLSILIESAIVREWNVKLTKQ
ncbi:unnamed protein product [Echinostoma caproni]|uniref:MIF4G domain-containing protein n=1 Tax=Echinostoma caproni TaxID=27848 RepID=A0A183A7E2_9TREM|nr:unnamed protein product [Echinostoma caproni]